MKNKIIVFFTIFSILFSFLNAGGAKADAVTPAADTAENHLIFSGQTKIAFYGTLNGQSHTVDFLIDSANLGNVSSQVARSVIGASSSEYDKGLWGYRISAGKGGNNVDYSIKSAALPNGKDGTNVAYLNTVGPFMLIGGKGTAKGGINYFNLGMYYCTSSSLSLTISPTCGAMKKLDDTEIFHDFTGTGVDTILRPMAKLLNNGLMGQITNASGTDLNSMCTLLKVDWDSLKQMVRDFFIPTPDQSNKNPNWTTNNTAFWDSIKSDAVGTIKTTVKAGLLAAAGLVYPPAQLSVVSTIMNGSGSSGTTGVVEMYPTNVGADNGQKIYDKATEIKDLLTKINASTETPLSGGSANWKCGSAAQLSAFKWDVGLAATNFTKTDDLAQAVDKLISDFSAFKKATTVTAPKDECAAPDNTIMGMIDSGFCGLIKSLKENWADRFFKMAVNWLKTSLGIAENGSVSVGGGGGGVAPANAASAISLSSSPKLPSTAQSDFAAAAQANNGYVDAGIMPINSSGKSVPANRVPGSVQISGSGNAITVKAFSQAPLVPLPNSNKFAVQFVINGKGYQFIITSDGSQYKPGDISQLSSLPTIPSPASNQQYANQCDMTDASIAQVLTIQEKAKAVCNGCKPKFDEASWAKGPCLSKNISNYAIDVAHSPRNATIDDANTCGSPNKYVELDLSCNVITTYPKQ